MQTSAVNIRRTHQIEEYTWPHAAQQQRLGGWSCRAPVGLRVVTEGQTSDDTYTYIQPTGRAGVLQGSNANTSQGVKPVQDQRVEALFAAVTKGAGLM